MISEKFIKDMPKIELHEHLDGGLKPSTILELADIDHIPLPAATPEELKACLIPKPGDGGLDRYLSFFKTTLSVLQTERGLERAAYECMETWASDHVIYGETRFAPKLHTRRGLTIDQVIAAVIKGLHRGQKDFGIGFGLIICAMRDESDSLSIAKKAAEWLGKGVVGFDISGPEAAYPPSLHGEAYHWAHKFRLGTTCHAGEETGPSYIAEAMDTCHPQRLGHGIHLVQEWDTMEPPPSGSLARYLLDRQIPIEICLTSNIQTGAAGSYNTHPFGRLYRWGFNTCICTDNRLISDTTLSWELSQAVEFFSLEKADLLKLQTNALMAAFLPWEKKQEIHKDLLTPYFQ